VCGCPFQMKCVHCNVHFCWLCGRLVDGGTFPDHYQASAIGPLTQWYHQRIEASTMILSTKEADS
jgi:hypothetical protein